MENYGLKFSEPRRVQTKLGARIVRTAEPTHQFWAAWKTNKEQIKAQGFSVGKHPNSVDFQVTLWQEVPEELRKSEAKNIEASSAAAPVEQSSESRIDIPAPTGKKYFPFQVAGIEYARGKQNVLIADEMGCVDGDAIINVNRGGKGFKVKLRDAYFRMRQKSRENWNWDTSIPTYARSLCNGELRLNLVKNILYKGVKPVLKIVLKSRKSIRVTEDHEIACVNGWRKAGKLRPGIEVLTNGVTGVCNGNYKTGKFVDNDGYVRVSGQQKHPRQHGGQVYEHVLVMESHIGRFLKWPTEQVHHINGNRADNRIENLELVSPSQHHRRHSKHLHLNRARKVMFLPVADPVVSVERDGEIDVYDIVMSDPHRNFVANGIIVHNCGKTIQAIGVLNDDASLKRVLVVCPASLKQNWANEIKSWLLWERPVYIANGQWQDGAQDYGSIIVIINYDVLEKHLDKLTARPWDCVIFDESHKLKNPKAKRTQAAFKIKARRRIALTGTPILNKPLEIWSLCQQFDPTGLGQHFFGFAKRYCNAHQNKFGWDFSGASNLDELQKYLRARFMVRRMKADVLTELPAKVRQVVALNLSAKDKAEIARIEAGVDYVEAIEALDKKTAAFDSVAAIRKNIALAKVPAAIEFVQEVLETGPVVLFAHHKDVIANVLAAFPEADCITGDTPVEDRQSVVDNFQNGKIDLIVCSIHAAGVGLTLTRSSRVIFLELDWTPGIMQQAEDRCHRIGQRDSVLVQHLVADNSLDAHIAETLIRKQEVIEKALDKTA